MKIKKLLVGLSFFLNGLALLFFLLAAALKTTSFSFYNMDGREQRYTSAVAVVSIPSGGRGGVTFGPLEITLKKGGRAAIQFSAVADKRQANWFITPLYDHAVISHEMTGYGIIITAVEAGETVMQTVSNTGITDIAVIKVTE